LRHDSGSATLGLCRRAGARALKKHAQDYNKSGHGNGPKKVSEYDEGVSDWSYVQARA
jgi:hypothetical protein